MLPEVAVSRKFKQRSSVVLPEPDEPIIAKTSPFSSEKLISFNTSVLPKTFSIFLTSKIAIILTPEIT